MVFINDIAFLSNLSQIDTKNYIGIFILIMFELVSLHIREQNKENHIHDEIVNTNKTKKEIIRMICKQQSNIPPPEHYNNLFLEEYKKEIEHDVLEEKNNIKYRNLSPVRNKKTNKKFPY